MDVVGLFIGSEFAKGMSHKSVSRKDGHDTAGAAPQGICYSHSRAQGLESQTGLNTWPKQQG